MTAAADYLVLSLDGPDDFAGFRQAARVLLALQVEPDSIHWRWDNALLTGSAGHDLFSIEASGSAAGQVLTPDMLDRVPLPASKPVQLKKEQLATLSAACCYRNPARFLLCYRWLWRVKHEPKLAGDVLDADWCAIAHFAQAVKREIHKMHAFIRFRPTLDAQGQTMHIAWFEPEHHVVRAGAGFFKRRFTPMRWAILTPEISVYWDLQSLQFAPGASADQAPGPDAGEALWLAYYAATFNPARLKEQTMLREMPRRYWKNLPETQLISELVASAHRRTERMLAANGSLTAPDHPYPEVGA